MGLLDQILALVDNGKKVATKNTKDFVANPKDFLAMVTDRVSEQNKKLASGDPEQLDNMLSSGLSGPASLVGMIRKGGRTDLNMVHNIGDSLDNFINLVMRRGSISSPSVAIAKDNIHPFAGTSTLVMNPSSPLFDPAQQRVNQLINRDMYASRAKVPTVKNRELFDEQPDGSVIPAKEHPSTWQMRQGKDARFGEGGGPPESSQVAAILASPKFSSLAEYEKSKYGAKTLVHGSEKRNIAEESETVAGAYRAFLEDSMPFNIGDPGPLNASVRNPENMQFLKSKAVSGDKEAKHLLDLLRGLPSDYAELKMVGELPMSPRDISALIIPADRPTLSKRADVKAFADKTGVRTGTPEELMPKSMESTYEDMTSSIFKLIKDRSTQYGLPPEGYKSLPDSVKKYVPYNAADYAVTKKGEDYLLQQIKNSSQYEADVASILTAEDADITAKTLKLLQERSQ